MHSRRGDQALDLALAHWAFLFIQRAEALDLLKTVAACFAAVFIKGHLAGTPAYVTIAVLNPKDSNAVHAHNARLDDSLRCAQRIQDLRRDLTIDLHNRHRRAMRSMPAARRPAEGEVRDVDSVFAKDGADPSNHAGNIVIAHGEQRPLQRRFDV